jgi:hypothetical protein
LLSLKNVLVVDEDSRWGIVFSSSTYVASISMGDSLTDVQSSPIDGHWELEWIFGVTRRRTNTQALTCPRSPLSLAAVPVACRQTFIHQRRDHLGSNEVRSTCIPSLQVECLLLVLNLKPPWTVVTSFNALVEVQYHHQLCLLAPTNIILYQCMLFSLF